jgi:hypothetical protein
MIYGTLAILTNVKTITEDTLIHDANNAVVVLAQRTNDAMVGQLNNLGLLNLLSPDIDHLSCGYHLLFLFINFNGQLVLPWKEIGDIFLRSSKFIFLLLLAND